MLILSFHSEHYNDENQHPEPCSPTKVKRSILDDLSSPTKSPSKRPESFVTPARKLTITRPDGKVNLFGIFNLPIHFSLHHLQFPLSLTFMLHHFHLFLFCYNGKILCFNAILCTS